jgi:acyl carrier protein
MFAGGPPLRGVFHAAGELDDCTVCGLTADRFTRALASKLAGAWNLHEATSELLLDYFVLYSSASALLGPPGQASYASANAFLDSLAHYRRRLGLPALSLNWGPWSAGMSTVPGIRGDFWSDSGFARIEPDRGMAMLLELMRAGVPQGAAVDADWRRFVARSPGARCPAVLRGLVAAQTVDRSDATRDFIVELDRLPAEARLPALRDRIRALARQVLAQPAAHFGDDASLIENGFDSLLAVEFRNALAGLLGERLPSTLVFDYPTVDDLSRYVAGEVLHWAAQTGDQRRPAPIPDKACSTSIDDLSEQELREWIFRQTEKWSTET